MIKLHYTTDLLCGVFQTNLPMLFASGEKSAHSLTIQLREGREPAVIHSPTVKAYFIRSDKSTVFWSGSISGSTVSVTMKESCYVQPGGFSLIIMIGDEDDRTAVFWGVGTVVRSATDSLVDPGGQIPSLEALLALIGTIEAATDAAHEATTAANSAASAANTAAGQAIAAASTATSAAGQATSAAGEAHAAAGTANAAAEGADDAAAVVIATAQSIEEMTVAASSLPAGSNPTAEISDVDGHKHVAFGIPAGQTGPKGDTGATPDISIGTVTTGAPGTEASATLTGTAESPVLNLTIPRGNPGGLDNIPWYAGTPSAAGTASPGTSDQVARGDHVHQMPTAEQVGARSNDWLPDGLIYPTTALEIEAMSQEQQAALYGKGYRAIVATYGETVTTHALAEDGSLAWVGDIPQKILENENFAIAQAGYGGTHGTQVYAADRWAQSDGSATFSQASGGGLSIQMSQAGHIYQKMSETPSGNFTLAVNVGGVDYVSSGAWPDGSGAGGIGVDFPGGNIYADATFGVVIYFTSSCTIARARLLRGSYTRKTLPPWVSPDYSSELLKCQLCYENSWFGPGKSTTQEYIGQIFDRLNADARIEYKQHKRVTPTVLFHPGGGREKWVVYNGGYYAVGNVTAIMRNGSSGFIARVTKGSDDQPDWEPGKCLQVQGHWESCADW